VTDTALDSGGANLGTIRQAKASGDAHVILIGGVLGGFQRVEIPMLARPWASSGKLQSAEAALISSASGETG